MRVLVCGSRDYTNRLLMTERLCALQDDGYDTLIEGEARGADTIAKLAGEADHFRIRGGTAENWRKSEGNLHRRLFTLEGLCGLFKHYGFDIEKAERTGYGPAFFLAPLLRGLYAGNLVVKVRKTRGGKDA